MNFKEMSCGDWTMPDVWCMVHIMARKTKFIYIGLHEALAHRVREVAKSSNTRISSLVQSMLDKHYPESSAAADEANEPIVITGQGDYQTIIRPTDIA